MGPEISPLPQSQLNQDQVSCSLDRLRRARAPLPLTPGPRSWRLPHLHRPC